MFSNGADIVTNARTLIKPLILIDPDSLAVKRERFSAELFSDPEMSYLNRIGNRDAVPAKEKIDPEERVQRFFQEVDAKAASIAPRFRLWVAASVIMNGNAFPWGGAVGDMGKDWMYKTIGQIGTIGIIVVLLSA